jgi:hypothetical protein
LSKLANQALEWELADKELGGLLVAPDLAESDSAWAIPVRLLNASRSWGILAGCLGSKLLTRSLTSCGLSGSLLCSGHFSVKGRIEDKEGKVNRVRKKVVLVEKKKTVKVYMCQKGYIWVYMRLKRVTLEYQLYI